MKKKKEIPWASMGLAVGLAFAWTKLGLGAAVKDVIPLDPTQLAGVVAPVNGRCPAGWIKVGNRCVKL